MSKNINLGEYYEAKLQLRPKDKELLNFVLKNLEPIKVFEYKFGYDLYFKDNKKVFKLVQSLKSNFKGEEKRSKTIYSKKGNEIIYRYTYLFRLDE